VVVHLPMPSSVIAPNSARGPARESAAQPSFELSLFGTLAARCDGRVLPLRLPQQAVRLLAFLLLHRDRPLLREHVAFTLWPDSEAADARANLRRKLHLITRALPQRRDAWILTTATTIGWNYAMPCRIDIAEFEALSSKTESAAAADSLYVGDLLVGMYDDWLERERERLRGLAIGNLLKLTAKHESRREFAEAIRYCQRLRTLDPWREDAVRTIIALRFESGDRPGALAEFERFRSALACDVGVAPMPETVIAYERVLANADIVKAAGAGAPKRQHHAPVPSLPFVGRVNELDRLRTAWACTSAGTGTAILVAGEAGIGKTRLMDQFARLVESNGGRVIRGGTTPFELAPYQAISEAIRSALPILRETRIEPVWLAVLATLAPQLRIAFPNLPCLAQLDAEAERTRLFDAAAMTISAMCAGRPTLIVLEDVHWSGMATISLFEHLARIAPHNRLLIIASYREEESHRTHPLRAFRRRLERERLLDVVALGPLDIASIENILEQLVDSQPEIRETIARSLLEVSDGNPFFLSEVVANTSESGSFNAQTRDWHSMPPAIDSLSLTSTLRERLERLSPRARSIAEVAAVIGRSFSVELVREVSGVDERSALDSLGELIDRRLVREVDTSTSDFAFSHHLILNTVYAAMAPEARLRRHRRAGSVIEELYADRIEERATELASHFDRCGESKRAAEYYLLAARQALALHGSDEANALAARGLELAGEPVTSFRLVEILEEASRRLGDRAAARAAIERLESIAAMTAEPEFIREALRRRAALAHACAERDEERSTIDALETRLVDAPSPWPAIFAQLKGSYLTAIGSYREARTVMAGALNDVSARDHPRIYVECRCALVDLAGFEGRVGDVRAFLDEVPMFERTYGGAGLMTLLETACAGASRIQDYAALGACAERLLTASHAAGYREGEAAAYKFAGRAALRQFQIDRARDCLARATEMFASMGLRLKQFHVLIETANLTTMVGRFDEAIAQFESADVVAESISYGFGRAACANNISYAAYLKGDYALARSAAIRALAAADRIEAPSARAHALVSLGIAERELAELDAAIGHLEEGTALERALNERLAYAEDLCELVITLLRRNDVERAAALAATILETIGETELQFTHPQHLLWTVAAVRFAQGDRPAAGVLLTRARQALDELEAAMPDRESRLTFRGLRYNRAIDEAVEHDRWQI
jgi:DNA-binding SARP family transcriptional activator/tetratricopeptide (TPR) repeat protein